MTVTDLRPDYPGCLAALLERLAEPLLPASSCSQALAKWERRTSLLEIEHRLGDAAVYLAADGPEATCPRVGTTVDQGRETAAAKGRAVVLVDEAHLLPNWAARLKGEWDRLKRKKIRCTSSHRLVGAPARPGSKESLAGRFERIILTHWSPMLWLRRLA